MNTYYCVWWGDYSAPPEGQLMGICTDLEGAESLKTSLVGFTAGRDISVYITEETTTTKGECQ